MPPAAPVPESSQAPDVQPVVAPTTLEGAQPNLQDVGAVVDHDMPQAESPVLNPITVEGVVDPKDIIDNTDPEQDAQELVDRAITEHATPAPPADAVVPGAEIGTTEAQLREFLQDDVMEEFGGGAFTRDPEELDFVLKDPEARTVVVKMYELNQQRGPIHQEVSAAQLALEAAKAKDQAVLNELGGLDDDLVKAMERMPETAIERAAREKLESKPSAVADAPIVEPAPTPNPGEGLSKFAPSPTSEQNAASFLRNVVGAEATAPTDAVAAQDAVDEQLDLHEQLQQSDVKPADETIVPASEHVVEAPTPSAEA